MSIDRCTGEKSARGIHAKSELLSDFKGSFAEPGRRLERLTRLVANFVAFRWIFCQSHPAADFRAYARGDFSCWPAVP
ncbi:hypothetical protein RB568 [Rhodopirellula baltica SH 1]|uniref:Uncharacterized protein n=1 Tax=Rhodopirellula baltica (strain DSM 10527 / NCIMB 13988 / SH1) TaxID=243090 RepID=Q7UYI6_RHOBA|nr:hypothetical protein RB568 [Rhodopirellula baltica SH 1]